MYGRGAAVLLLLILGTQPAIARGQLQAGPTLLEIGVGAGSARLTLRNTGDAPVAAQVRIYAWSQPEGQDHLVLTEDLAISPPIAQLPPGGRQLVRLVALAAPSANRDGSYRVVVDELPGTENGDGGQVNLRMRFVIPLFVRAADAAPTELRCTIRPMPARLVCENRGGRAAQLGATRLLDARGGHHTLGEGLFGYVLPGSRRVWPLPAVAAELDGATLRLETLLNGQPAMLAVERLP